MFDNHIEHSHIDLIQCAAVLLPILGTPLILSDGCPTSFFGHLFADYKSLVGNHLTILKECRELVVKQGARLLNQYGNVDMIIEHIDEITPISIKESLKNNIEKLRENLLLIKLNKNVSHYHLI